MTMVSRGLLRIYKAVESAAKPYQRGGYLDDQADVRDAFNFVLMAIDEEIEAEAERQFTRPISQQAELSKNLKEDK